MVHINPFHTILSYFFNINSVIKIPFTARFSKNPSSFRFSHQNPVSIYLASHSCHMPLPSHSPWYAHPYKSWSCAQIKMLLAVQLSPVSYFSSSALGRCILSESPIFHPTSESSWLVTGKLYLLQLAHVLPLKLKVNFTLEQAMDAQRGSRGVVLHFL